MSPQKMCCPQCEGIELIFDEDNADEDLRAYRAEGPDQTTAWLLDELKAQGVEGLTLLDIGGGVGAIQHELLSDGVSSAVHVDASSAYIAAAKREAKRRKLAERITWHHGNFVDLAPDLQTADIVTLDKVICCYDDMPALVRASTRLAGRYYGIILPRNTWWFRAAAWVMNAFQRIIRNPYRMFVHPHEKIEALIRRAGFKRSFTRHNLLWHVAVYTR
ncbi:MAG: methyltransferase domain-containing protein [Anaerolineales bacterium]